MTHFLQDAEGGVRYISESALVRSSLKTVTETAIELTEGAKSHIRRVGLGTFLDYSLDTLHTRELIIRLMDRYDEGSLPDDENSLTDEYSFFLRVSPEKYVLVNPEAVHKVLGTSFATDLADSVSGNKCAALQAMFTEVKAAGFDVECNTRRYNYSRNEYEPKI